MTDSKILKYFADYIESQLGIIYSETNYFQLEHRLKEIATQLNLKDVNELYQFSLTYGFNGKFKALLLDLATNNETSFFRDQAVFKVLSSLIYPEVCKLENNQIRGHISIWSAAASSGQEVYSIAMELQQCRLLNPTLLDFKILATDISDTILKRCENAIYSQLEVQRGLPAKMLIDYFQKENESSWQIKPELRKNIEFKKMNLLDPWYGHGPFQIVFCRNVLIYQSVENKKKVIEKIYHTLSPNGFLVLGAAESLFGISEQFEQLHHGNAVFYKKK